MFGSSPSAFAVGIAPTKTAATPGGGMPTRRKALQWFNRAARRQIPGRCYVEAAARSPDGRRVILAFNCSRVPSPGRPGFLLLASHDWLISTRQEYPLTWSLGTSFANQARRSPLKAALEKPCPHCAGKGTVPAPTHSASPDLRAEAIGEIRCPVCRGAQTVPAWIT